MCQYSATVTTTHISESVQVSIQAFLLVSGVSRGGGGGGDRGVRTHPSASASLIIH